MQLLLVHVCFGGIGIASGLCALSTSKGSYPHRIAGRVFVVSMVFMALLGSVVAFQKPEMITFLGGLFTTYLVVTAWLTLKSSLPMMKLLSVLLMLTAMYIGIAGVFYGWQAVTSESGLKDGFPSGPYFFFGLLAMLCAASDMKSLFYGASTGMRRIARHTWRMCFALIMATASFFDGPGAKSFPDSMQGSVLLLIPQGVVAVLLCYWLIQILYFKRIVRK